MTAESKGDISSGAAMRASVQSVGIDVAVSGLTDLLDLDMVGSVSRLFIEIKNNGSHAFDAFKVQRKAQKNGSWETLADVAADFSSPQNPILEVQGAPVTLAAAAKCYMKLDVTATFAIRIQASANTTATTADVYYTMT